MEITFFLIISNWINRLESFSFKSKYRKITSLLTIIFEFFHKGIFLDRLQKLNHLYQQDELKDLNKYNIFLMKIAIIIFKNLCLLLIFYFLKNLKILNLISSIIYYGIDCYGIALVLFADLEIL